MVNQKLKVNLHICEYCNYSCVHCFAKFGCKATLSAGKWKTIIHNVISSGLVDEINIAGGEPLLHPQMMDIVGTVRSYGISVSLVTNGSLMTRDWILQHGTKFKTIGFSVDTLSPERQQMAGRCTAAGVVISPEEFERKITLLRDVNPEIKIKVNTVVSQVNKTDCLAAYIRRWRVDRWKLLKMQVFDDGVYCNAGIKVSDVEYDAYVSHTLCSLGIPFIPSQVLYRADNMEIVAERVLKGGYLMIDANGFLLDNVKHSGYTKVCDCQQERFAEGLQRLTFYDALYASRY